MEENFLKNGLSIDETKVSLLMISYVICFTIAIVFFVYRREGDNLLSMFYAVIAAVTGSSISNQLMSTKKG